MQLDTGSNAGKRGVAVDNIFPPQLQAPGIHDPGFRILGTGGPVMSRMREGNIIFIIISIY